MTNTAATQTDTCTQWIRGDRGTQQCANPGTHICMPGGNPDRKVCGVHARPRDIKVVG